MRFHRRCGDRITLLNDDCTAVRNFVEFNHGLILSEEPLNDDELFEICIERKVNVWNGSLEVGVTTLDPEFTELPATATKLRNTAWIMSGSSILKDGVTILNDYGPELDSLQEGDCLGLMRSSKGEFMIYINGRCLGVAVPDLPPRVFAVIDLYGQCVQVCTINPNGVRPALECGMDQVEEDPNNDDTLTSSEMEGAAIAHSSTSREQGDVYIPMGTEGACALAADRLRFHPRCGILVKLSANNKSAERARPLDDYNNGVVMTHRPLYDNELFEIRINRLVDKWSGSIEVGVTTHNPATIKFPSTMTNMDSGTIMMSGCKVLLNGHGTCMEYGNFNLDELREGDTVGVMRKPDGKLHYFINGVDQGVATDKVEQQVWGVVDIYGMTVKISIVDVFEDVDSNRPEIPNFIELAPSRLRPRIDEDSLLFHSLRDSNVIIINDGKTAHRPNAFEFFNNGIVMTNRTLRTNELFQVRLDLVIPKWAGSIEIGVTQHSSNDIQFPFKMSNAKTGTWAMTGEDVIRDGSTIIPQYVRNLNRLVEGDTVGVMRKDMGILHFYVNGVDQGPAAFNIPEHVFGIIDLYGRVAQATIADVHIPPPVVSPESPLSSESNATMYPEMCFHRVHGRNARLSHNRLTASRAAVYSEFNDAVLFSSRPLRECDMFELQIDKMVDCWIGSLEIGVTAIRPEDLEASGGVGAVAGTATDLNWDTYILSGAAMMKDGECVRSGYPLDLDTLTVGSRVGMMWHADRSLHYYLDGMDMGKAWYVPHLNIYAVIDLYGQCTQVTILQNEERAFNYNGCTNSDNSLLSHSRALSSPPMPYWSFSEYCGDNICLMHDYSIARRLTPDPMSTLVFSSSHLAVGEIFEIKILEGKFGFAGSFRIGVTDINILNAYVNRSLPPTISCLPHYTVYIDGRFVKYSKPGSAGQELYSFVPSFEWLRPGDRIGLKKTNDSQVFVYYNSEQLEISFEKVPDKVYVVMEMFGNVNKIQAVSRGANAGPALPQNTIPNDVYNRQPLPNNMNNNSNQLTASYQANAFTIPDSSTLDEVPDSPVEAGNIRPNSSQAREVFAGNYDTVAPPMDSGSISTVTLVNEPRRRRSPLPYTFHYIHGKNIKLCSSDTVALRVSGYKDGIAIVGQPLRKGHNFKFRVDKVSPEWSGSICIGAVGSLPTEAVPECSMHLEPPLWVVSSDVLNDNGICMMTPMAKVLEEIREQQVLTIHFRFNGELVLDVDGRVLGVIGYVPRAFSHVYPLIDLYGRVSQVSALLHPYVAMSGASLDLPIIAENLREELLAEEESEGSRLSPPNCLDFRMIRRPKAYSQDNLVEDQMEPLVSEAGPSTSEPFIPLYPHTLNLQPLYPHSFNTPNFSPPNFNSQPLKTQTFNQPPYNPEPNNSQQCNPEIFNAGPYNPPSCSYQSFNPDAFNSQTFEGPSNPQAINFRPFNPRNFDPQVTKPQSSSPIPSNPRPHNLPPFSNLMFNHRPLNPHSQFGTDNTETANNEIRYRQVCPDRMSFHQSLILLDHQSRGLENNEMYNHNIQKSHSTHSFCQVNDNNQENVGKETVWYVTSQNPDDDDVVIHQQLCDTNIQHNDRYPEANDVDNLDNEIMDALTLETGNLPDLTEEQSSSIDESTRRDDIWPETLSLENLNYLNRILCLDQEGAEAHSLESEWEASGEGCEHLHLVLKFWNFLVLPYPELRRAVSWGQVRCYCYNCQPDAQPHLAGWVRIERIDGVGACTRAFWHLLRNTLGSAQGQTGTVRRPRVLAPFPCVSPSLADVWFDEEGKPHHTILAVEIDVEGSDAENDRLLAFLIYLKSHMVFMDDNPPSSEE